jgi:hypothetical protein
MKRALLPTLALVLALGVALPIAAPVAAHTEWAPLTLELYAGQNTWIGEVFVWNDDTDLHVTYYTDGGWGLVETHLAVATSLDGIPHNNRGNPKIGKFPYKGSAGEFYTIDLDWADGTTLYIAFHAVATNWPCPEQETAWPLSYCTGGGYAPTYQFPGNSWATYFTYVIQ